MAVQLNIKYLTFLLFFIPFFAYAQPVPLKNNHGYFYEDEQIQYFLNTINQKSNTNFLINEQTLDTFEIIAGYLNDHQLFEPALLYYSVVHDLAKKLDQELRMATALHNMSQIYIIQGNHNRALKYSIESKEVLEHLGVTKELSSTYNNLGVIYQNLGSFDKARKWYQKAITIREKADMKENLVVSYINLGGLFYLTGQYESAIKWFDQAKFLSEKLHLDIKTAIIDNHAGLAYGAMGNYDKALSLLNQSIQVLELSADRISLASAYNNIGLIYSFQNNYQYALTFFNKATKILEELHLDHNLIEVYTNIGELFFKKEDYKLSRKYFKKSIDIQKKLNLTYLLVLSYNNMGLISLEEKDYTNAINWFNKALLVAQKNNIHHNSYLINIYNNLGSVYHETGRLNKALTWYRKAMKVQEKSIQETNLIYVYTNLANLYQDILEPDSALLYANKSILLSEKLRTINKSTSSRRAYVKNSFSALDVGINSTYKLKKYESAFKYSELLKARSLSDLLVTPKIVEQELPRKTSRAYLTVLTQINELDRIITNEVNDSILMKLTSVRDSLFMEKKRLKDQIYTEAPQFADLVFPNPVTKDLIQGTLDKHEALISFSINHQNVFAFIITVDQFEMIDLGDTKNLISLMKNFLIGVPKMRVDTDILQQERAKKQFFLTTHQLYKKLWLPLTASGLIKGKDIHVISDGISNFMPFELLITDTTAEDYSDYEYLIKKHSFCYYPSASVFYSGRLNQKRTIKFEKSFLGIALSNFQHGAYSTQRMPVANLIHSINEIEMIGNLFQGNNKILINSKATESFVKSNDLRIFRYIHFSTHGLIDLEKSNFSKILLYPDEQEDGNLHLYEVFDLDLDADLISVSACETGRGQLLRGEGILGFTRALMYAGTPSVILSLWKVSEESTKDLFINYYKELSKDGKDKYIPLRRVQLEMIKSGGKYANPYYWAPFIFIGERKSNY